MTIDYQVTTEDDGIHVTQWDEETAEYTDESIVIDVEDDTVTLRNLDNGYIWNESLKVLRQQVTSFIIDFDEAVNLVS